MIPAPSIPSQFRDFLRARIRLGSRFRARLAELNRTERLGSGDLEAFQLAALRQALVRAGRSVPYYRRLFADIGFDPAAISSLADLTSLPTIDKARVRERPAEFRDHSILFTTRGYTSGTTGTPLVVQRDLDSVIHENAMIWRQRLWFGVKPGDRIAVLRGEVVTPAANTGPPFWREDRFARELVLSSHHLAPQHAAAYHQALTRFAPAALYAYPSSAGELARLFRDQRLDPPPLRAVFTASETLRREDGEIIAHVFRAPVVDRYGNAERTLAGGHCERGGYHMWTDCTLLELLPAIEDSAEMVGTPLTGRAMPLFRYRTGDHATGGAPPCPCGRVFPVVERVEGRLDPLLVTPDGRRIGRLDHVWKGVEHISSGQIVQEADLTVRLKVVPEPGYSEVDRSLITAHARDRLGPGMNIIVEEVDRLPRTRSGKFQAVVSLVEESDDERSGGREP